jgi:PAS domain-containing protein
MRRQTPLETVWRDQAEGKDYYGTRAVPMIFFRKTGVCVFHRRSDLKHVDLEEQLRQEQEKYRAATEGANLRVYEYDIRSHTIYSAGARTRKLFGVPSAVMTRDVPESHPAGVSRRKTTQRVRCVFSPAWTAERKS